MQISCVDCGCLPPECKSSKSRYECPNCIREDCCCWSTHSDPASTTYT